MLADRQAWTTHYDDEERLRWIWSGSEGHTGELSRYVNPSRPLTIKDVRGGGREVLASILNADLQQTSKSRHCSIVH